ncbi:Gfo/Idh/MocA family protein [Sphingosinicella sp. CPCC 101087]|uniref:Gfo/Idh/MocA family protein n=1 Tax=Sphingosinicella sp. CPCC 101087 TaxID=2497754 RepID=UPI00101C5682|nr:Gfo/Idh/MocA family oxidoreductase [Sphingosinicella sp. CPCC 101087]
MSPIRVAIVGIGKIARDQHLPALAANPDFDLVGGVTRHEPPDGLDGFRTLADLAAARPDVDAISLCTPPQGRYALAREAIERGYHVMLEKPPGATVAEVEALIALARDKGVALFATWHSREAPAVETARTWLSGRGIHSVGIVWKEDVRRWHPGQAWIWEPGGLGIFDPGINALSIATRILPQAMVLHEAELFYPANRQAPIAARLSFTHDRAPVEVELDWRQIGPQTWDIIVETDSGQLTLSSGGAAMAVDGQVVFEAPEAEYPNLYARFAELVRARAVDADLAPFRHVADAFLLGRRLEVEPFED